MIKAFPTDKNYMLLEAQEQSKGTFPFDVHSIVRDSFFKYCNPLGIVDNTVQQIMDYVPGDMEGMEGLYENLSIAYRYIHGDNQLEFVWDGRSHVENYMDIWRTGYKAWLSDMCRDISFLKLLLVLTVFRSPEKNYMILENRLKGAVNTKFDIKIKNHKLKVA